MKLDRMLGILTILLQKDRVTAPELAAKFEVNRRTIGRDIDALCQAGIPVVTHQGAGGGLSIAEGFKLDKSVLTSDELSGIITALKGLGSVSAGSNIERTLDKLHANSDAVISLREPVIIDLASHYGGQLTDKIEKIKRAVLESQSIAFDYLYDKGQSHRRIEPYFVLFQWTAWYVFGFCRKRQDWRMFKLLRLWMHCRIQSVWFEHPSRDLYMGMQYMSWARPREGHTYPGTYSLEWLRLSRRHEIEPIGNWIMRRHLELFREAPHTDGLL